jgi:diphthamide biosynthesis protein 4
MRERESMAYTKNYYTILGLEAPSPGPPSDPSSTAQQVRRAYKLALLATHPDRAAAQGTYTVDDVKEAYAILSNPQSRAEYNEWVLRHPGEMTEQGRRQGGTAPSLSSDFLLGLELLDLSDFDVLDPKFEFGGEGEGEGEGEGQMEWTRACRCGAERGFRIAEEELVDAEAAGEKEVLVGCEGCSLWVRVGFEVEEG